MDPRHSAQDVLLCDFCKTDPLQSRCKLCNVNLCLNCVGRHLSDFSKDHNVVPFFQRSFTSSFPKCTTHAEKHCELHCEKCDIPVCSTCVTSNEHRGHKMSDALEKLGFTEDFSDSSQPHNAVYLIKGMLMFLPSFLRCPKHAAKNNSFSCEKCDITVCSICVTSGEHLDHTLTDVLPRHVLRARVLQDLEELEIGIYPRYKEMECDVQTEKAELETKYGKLITAAEQHGESLHREITAIVNQRKSEIEEMKSKHLAALNENKDEITNRITELRQNIKDLKNTWTSNDVSLTSTYKSRNSEFRTLPPKVRVTLPSFSPQEINKDHLKEMYGSLSSIFIKKEHGETMKSPDAVSSPPVKPMKSPDAVSSPPLKPMKSPEAVSSPPLKSVKSPEAVSSPPVEPMKSPEAVSSPPLKPLLDEPRFPATTNTGYNYLYGVSCLPEDQVWACGNNNIMKLLTVQGELLSSVQTKSGNHPGDIAVTREGDLVYTDYSDRTINLVKNSQTRIVIILQGWRPRNIYSTASGNLLVTMLSDDGEPTKVVRYFGSKEKQIIQYDDQRRPLYSCDPYTTKYISENQNLDICVADRSAKSVVVVNQSGTLRFRYTGHPSNTGQSFSPVGITTDSQSQILTADFVSGRIHILDQDGQFLRYIHNLRAPWGLCVDSKDNLFVANGDNKVYKIQYL